MQGLSGPTVEQIKKLYLEFEHQAEGERLIIFCHPLQHERLLKELNKMLDKLGREQFWPPRASLVPSWMIDQDKIAVTKRKYMDLEYQDEFRI